MIEYGRGPVRVRSCVPDRLLRKDSFRVSRLLKQFPGMAMLVILIRAFGMRVIGLSYDSAFPD